MDYKNLKGNTIFICEKFEVAEALTTALGKSKDFANSHKKNKFIPINDNTFISWCDGHILEHKLPEKYNDKYKKWSLEDLPLNLSPYEFVVSSDKVKNFNVIKELIKKADNVIHCGDADEEGQIIVDEVLEKLNYHGNVYRYHMNNNTTIAIQKELANLKDNTVFKGITTSVKARIIADLRFGINLTRLYTSIIRNAGEQSVANIGRVKTPMTYLVYLREQENSNHSSTNYYTISADIDINNQSVKATYKKAEIDKVDDKGRLIDKDHAFRVAEFCKGKEAEITSVITSTKQTSAPLPFSMSTLQILCSSKLGIEPDIVMKVTQNLRTKHSLITYNRSLSQFLNEDQHLEAPEIINAIASNLTSAKELIAKCDTSFKSPAFDNEKVDPAHHGIIPTQEIVDFTKLDDLEKKVYEIIANRYLAQFLGNYEYDNTIINLTIGSYAFIISSNVPLKAGWKAILGKDDLDEETEEELSLDLRTSKVGDRAICTNATATENKTKPKPLFTTKTFLKQLSNAADYIKDENLRKVLRNKDKTTKGENGGIGTPATRDSIIKELYDNDFLTKDTKGYIRTTQKAQSLFKTLSENILYPDMTAYWWSQQLKIKEGSLSINEFLKEIDEFIENQVKSVDSQALKDLFTIDYGKCPECQNPLQRLKGKHGVFYGCSNFKNGCKFSVPEKNGKPDFSYKPQQPEYAEEKCPECQNPLQRLKGKHGIFYGCSNFKNGCKFSVPEKNGKPDFDYKPQQAEKSDYKCPDCGSDIVKRTGKNGIFWACSGFPKCKKLFGNKDKPDIPS